MSNHNSSTFHFLVKYLHNISHCLTKPAQASSNAPLCMDSINCFLKYSPITSFLNAEKEEEKLYQNAYSAEKVHILFKICRHYFVKLSVFNLQ